LNGNVTVFRLYLLQTTQALLFFRLLMPAYEKLPFVCMLMLI